MSAKNLSSRIFLKATAAADSILDDPKELETATAKVYLVKKDLYVWMPTDTTTPDGKVVIKRSGQDVGRYRLIEDSDGV